MRRSSRLRRISSLSWKMNNNTLMKRNKITLIRSKCWDNSKMSGERLAMKKISTCSKKLKKDTTVIIKVSVLVECQKWILITFLMKWRESMNLVTLQKCSRMQWRAIKRMEVRTHFALKTQSALIICKSHIHGLIKINHKAALLPMCSLKRLKILSLREAKNYRTEELQRQLLGLNPKIAEWIILKENLWWGMEWEMWDPDLQARTWTVTHSTWLHSILQMTWYSELLEFNPNNKHLHLAPINLKLLT